MSIHIRNILAAGILAALPFGFAGGAKAATVNNTDLGSLGYSFTTSWAIAQGGENVAANGTLTLDSVVGDSWSFTYVLANTSNFGAELGAWGFGTTPDVASFSLTSAPTASWKVSTQGPNGTSALGESLGAIDECATSGPNCNGNASGGFTGTGTFTFDVTFSPSVTSFILDASYARFQSTGTNNGGSAKLLGTWTENCVASPANNFCGDGPGVGGEVPLPAALPMLLTALGGVGVIARRRRKNAA